MAKSSSTDTQYLEKKGGRWRVTIAVPRRLHDKLGTRLKRSLKTDSLVEANRAKPFIVAELKAEIARAEGTDPSPIIAEALAALRLRRASSGAALHEVDDAIAERAHQIAGLPIGSEIDAFGSETPVYNPARERDAIRFVEVASGTAVPIDLHHDDYLKQIKTTLTRRTVADAERALRFLRTWFDSKGLPFMLHHVTRRTAASFMDELAIVSGAPSKVTHQKYLTRLSRYWRWMMDRDLVEANPWASLRPVAAPVPYDEKERSFTDDEVASLLKGPATPAMQLLMRLAALSGARLDAIVRLRVGDCAEGVFVFQPQKKEKGPRRVPVHSAIKALINERCEGRQAADPLFPEWPAPANPASQRERSFKASNAFTDYRRSVKVDAQMPGKRRSLVNFHSFRRWFITKAEQAGQPESTIAACVGHTRPGMTFGRYSAGPKIEQLRECVEAVRLPKRAA